MFHWVTPCLASKTMSQELSTVSSCRLWVRDRERCRLHAAVPNSALAEIPDAAHMAHFDNPAAWLTSIRAFLTTPAAIW
jgi:hypothetical protein